MGLQSVFAAAALSMSSLAGTVAAGATNLMPSRRRRSKPETSFDPLINRWTGEPHEHKREIARRTRQRERQASNKKA
jgi:hypothetical protein